MSTAPFRPSPDSLSADAETGPDGLRRTLKRRHMNLIALGGVIGAGLFVGSGVVIHATGPAAI
ncbi:MAG: permease, partial [Pseudonocardiales bacterium]|nr:permease [Pseudonocardiales bacterium]